MALYFEMRQLPCKMEEDFSQLGTLLHDKHNGETDLPSHQ